MRKGNMVEDNVERKKVDKKNRGGEVVNANREIESES